jgi:hypothetical protein
MFLCALAIRDFMTVPNLLKQYAHMFSFPTHGHTYDNNAVLTIGSEAPPYEH